MEKVDIKTLHGHLFTCDKCNKFHFEFNQLGIDFSSLNSLIDFENYLSKLNGEEFEISNRNTAYRKKIQIPFPNTSIKILLSINDLEELKILLTTFIKDYQLAEKENILIKKLSNISFNQLN